MPHLVYPRKTALLGGISPVALGIFTNQLNDYDNLSTVSSMPTGGSITRAGNAYYFDNTGTLQTAGANTARFDCVWNGSTWAPRGLLVEGARTNLFLNSASPATQSITVTAQAYTLSFYGTGTITLSGASTAGPLVGTGANNRVTLTFTPSAASLTLTLSGTVTYPQLEAGAFASSYIICGGTATARNAETFTLANYTNQLVESFYIDEETGGSWSANIAPSATSPLTINPPTFGWVTSLRAYTNAYAGSISTPSWLSFSGTTGTTAGNRTYYDSTGTLTWAPANLLSYSQALGNPWWSKDAGVSVVDNTVAAPDGTTTASTATWTSAANIYKNLTSEGAGNYVMSVYASVPSGTANFVLQVYNATDGTLNSTTFTATTAWQRFSFRFTVSAGSFWIIRSSVAQVIYLWGAQLERVTYQTAPSAYIPTTSAAVYGPRYDYDPSTVPATPRGLLIEEQRVNLISLSQAISTWGSNSGFTPTANAAIAPDGTQTASLMVPSTTAPYMLRQGTVASTVCTASVYAKATGSTNRWLSFTDFGAASAKVWFDIYSGAMGTITAGYSGSITPVGNGWYRCVFGQTAAATNPYIEMHVSNANNSTTAVVDGVSGLYVWGAQIEHAGSSGSPSSATFATSYIPTAATAPVTRAPDVAQLTGSALTTLQGTSVSAIAEIDGTPTTAGTLISSGSNVLIAQYSSTQIYTLNNVPALIVASLGSGLTTSRFRGAVTYGPSSISIAGNNGTVVTSPYTYIQVPVVTPRMGSNNSGYFINSWYRSIALYNQRLPDAILKQKSVVNSPY